MIGLPDVVAEHGIEGRDVGRHARHERRHQARDRDAEQPVGQDVADHQQHRVVVRDVTGSRRLEVDHVANRRGGDHAGDHDHEGNEHLRERRDDRRPAGRQTSSPMQWPAATSTKFGVQ
jgi:hypothetical protein